jgi:hypothetical protein
LKNELGKLSGQGQQERDEAEKLVALQANKQVIPRIVELIHAAVPPLPTPLAEAKSQGDVLTAIRSGALPARGDREIVTIQMLNMHFEPNVNSYVWRSEVPAPEPLHDPEVDLSALKLEITVRTTFQGGMGKKYRTTAEFVAETFMKQLRRLGRQPGTGFHIDRVYLYAGNKVQTTAPSPGSSFPGPAGGRGGRFTTPVTSPGVSPAPVAGQAQPHELDPLTNERIVDDWEFLIWVDVVLEDTPESALEPDAGSEPSEG